MSEALIVIFTCVIGLSAFSTTIAAWMVYRRDRRLADALGLDLPDLSRDRIATLIADPIGDEAEVGASDAQGDGAEAAEDDAGTETAHPPVREPAETPVRALPAPEDTTHGVSDDPSPAPTDTAGIPAERVLSDPARR